MEMISKNLNRQTFSSINNRLFFILSRFQFSREEIQAFRDEHEQRNGDLTKPEEESSSISTKVSSIKRTIDLRCWVNLKEPLPITTTDNVLNQRIPAELLREARTTANDPFHYRFVRSI